MTYLPKAAGQDTHVFEAAPIFIPTKNHASNLSGIMAIHSEVVFGSPAMNCNGTGICRISSMLSVRTDDGYGRCQRTLARIVPGEKGKITLFFFRAHLCIQLFRKHFYKGMLEMTEPCEIPSELLEKLQIQTKTIQPGKYAILEKDGVYRLELDCR
jgi:hypothetical protein